MHCSFWAIRVLRSTLIIPQGEAKRTVGSDDPPPTDQLAAAIESLAIEMKIEVEGVELAEFMPLPEGAETRHRFIGHFGKLAVYVFDPYSIAISKIDRGFDTDLQDVLFLIKNGLITFEQLEQYAQVTAPR